MFTFVMTDIGLSIDVASIILASAIVIAARH